MDDRLYIVSYDIRDPKRWRAVFKTMKGYGEWLQLSVFQCRLTRRRHADLIATLDQIIHHNDDHILLVDMGPAERVNPRVTSLGKDFQALERSPTIV